MTNPHPDDVPASIIAEILDQVAGDEPGHEQGSPFHPSAPRTISQAEYLSCVRVLQAMLPTSRVTA